MSETNTKRQRQIEQTETKYKQTYTNKNRQKYINKHTKRHKQIIQL